MALDLPIFPQVTYCGRNKPLWSDRNKHLFIHSVRNTRDNYRPISVLSKLLKKHVAGFFIDYLAKNGLFYERDILPNQTDLRAKSFLIDLVDQDEVIREWFLSKKGV